MLSKGPHDLDAGATINARGAARRGPLVPIQAALIGASPAREVTRLDNLHRSLPQPLRVVPMPALLAWSGIGAITVAVLCAVATRSPKTIEALEETAFAGPSAVASEPGATSAAHAATAAPKPTATRAAKAELEGARLAGGEALAQLAQRFPEDPAVVQALFLVQASDKKSGATALRTARRLVELAPEAADDDEVRRALVSLANGPTETAGIALELMATALGQRGTEMLFEVASGSVLLSKTKAAALLNDPEVKRHATPALLIANDLRAALPCARKALLGRARAESDARSLPFLKPLVNTQCGGGGGGWRGLLGRAGGNGGGGECYRCFSPAERTDIQGIVSGIEARSPAPAPTTTSSVAP